LKYLLLSTLFAFLICASPDRSIAQQAAETSSPSDNQHDLTEADREFQEALKIWGNRKPAEAEKLLKSALATRERILGPKAPAVGDVVERLGALDYNRKDYVAAEKLFRRALEIYVTALGEKDLATSLALGDVGAAVREQGRYTEAEPYVQRSLATRRMLLPPDHWAIARSLDNLARIHFGERRYSNARSDIEEKLRIDRSADRPDNQALFNDRLFLLGISQAEHPLRTLLYAVLLMMGPLILLTGLTVLSEVHQPDSARQGVGFAVFCLKTLVILGTFGGAGYLGVFVFEWFLASVLPPAVLHRMPPLAGVGLLLGIWGASILVQVIANGMRKPIGLRPRPISFFPPIRRSQRRGRVTL
jgi:tetratricopeptide (TPR) repeat protein